MPCTVYPRPRGGTRLTSAVRPVRGGLSPPTRGNQKATRQRIPFSGSIPAHAGEPQAPTRARRGQRVYPRPRGGTSMSKRPTARTQGLSPPTRGNPTANERGEASQRSIPAHAGEPPPRGCSGIREWVYPRPRGGTEACSAIGGRLFGLSPPTRGNRDAAGVQQSVARSIPAHAGEPSAGSPRRCAEAVYPRPRGGTLRERVDVVAGYGLSPPTRGNRIRRGGRRQKRGSIPAHAGEPHPELVRHGDGEVYPRPRGGTPQRPLKIDRDRGLSPPTRGNRRPVPEEAAGVRSIPAHAGEPGLPLARLCDSAVYPRPRGGTRRQAAIERIVLGLSPPTRGNQFGRCVRMRMRGSIPAHAGEPRRPRPAGGDAEVYPRPRGGTAR